MKKLMIFLALTAMIMSVSACSAELADPLEKYSSEYERTIEATHIHQTVEVLDGALAMFIHETEYKLNGSAYSVTETRKKLNVLDTEGETPEEQEAYTEVERKTYVAEKAEIFALGLQLNKSFLKPGYRVAGNTFRAGVKDEFVDEVFGLTGERAEMSNVILEMTSDGERLSEISVRYKSDNETNVRITITFAY